MSEHMAAVHVGSGIESPLSPGEAKRRQLAHGPDVGSQSPLPPKAPHASAKLPTYRHIRRRTPS